MAKYENLIPRFVSYVKKNTRSDENSTTIPSTQSQVEFVKDLMAELKQIGMQNVRLNDQSGYVFATLPSNLPNGLWSNWRDSFNPYYKCSDSNVGTSYYELATN